MKKYRRKPTTTKYVWDENTYRTIREHRYSFDWDSFAEAKDEFSDWLEVPCPLKYGCSHHRWWNNFFSKIYGKKYCHYNWVMRVLCSVMITAAPANHIC